MKNFSRYRRTNRLSMALVCSTFFFLLLFVSSAFGETAKPALTDHEKLQWGERMYREGLLPSGEPVQAFVKGDLPVPGTSFTCVSCHLRSGLGSIEGGVVTPPTNGDNLFKPLLATYKHLTQKFFPLPPIRPAYTDATLAEAIRSGVVPGGHKLNDVMPRYLIDDADMSILEFYLKSLSAKVSPGVSDTNISFATVIAEDVRPEDRDAMLSVLDNFVAIKNTQVSAFKTQRGARSRLMAENMLASREFAMRTFSLSRWVLKGPPETWRAQLEEYNRKEPVFALLGGITNGDWRPIHQFSEENHIPSLFPITDFPVVSAADWYTLYFSKGYYQEGEAAARYLNANDGAVAGRPIIQVVRASREGQALSAGFLETWHDLGHQAPLTVTLKAGETISNDFLKKLSDREKPAAILLWGGSDMLPALDALAGDRHRPGIVFVSSSYLGMDIWALHEQIREFTYITYPFTFAQNGASPSTNGTIVQSDQQKTIYLKDLAVKTRPQKIASLSLSLTQILAMALMEMRGNYYRDNFLDVIGMVPDQNFTLYERLSFGPGQRYASKGCYIVQLLPGPVPELVKKSAWVIH